jgi:hypothetical protein
MFGREYKMTYKELINGFNNTGSDRTNFKPDDENKEVDPGNLPASLKFYYDYLVRIEKLQKEGKLVSAGYSRIDIDDFLGTQFNN